MDVKRRPASGEHASKESMSNYHILNEDTTTAYCLLDLEGRIVEANAGYIQLTGYQTLNDIKGRNPTEWTAPYDVERNARELEETPEKGGVNALRVDYLHSNGRIVPIQVLSALVETTSGTQILGLCNDLTTQIQAEKALQESRNLLSAIIEGASDFIFAKDLNYRHTMVNGAFASLLGKSEEEIIGKTNSDLFSPDNAKALDLEDGEVLKSGKTHRYENSIEIDGSIRTLLTTKFIHFDSEGNPAGVLGISHDITDRKLAEEKIRHLASHDELTGLPTLRLGRDRLSSAITLARRNKTSAAILYVDLDGFKEINDSKGHKAGDQVLNEVAERLIHTVRETDTVARVGGDEFVIVLTELTEEAAYVKVAEKVIKTLTRPIGINGQEVNISASIGIALYPDHGEIPDELINKADEAMYAVKRKGKNNYSMANGDLRE